MKTLNAARYTVTVAQSVPEKGPSYDGPFRAAGALTPGRSAWHEAVSRVHSRRRGADSQTNVKPQTLNPILKLSKYDFRPFSAKTPWKAPAFWVAGPAISKTALFGPNPLTRAPIFSASGRNLRGKLSEISGRIRVRVRDHPLFWGSKRAGLLRGLGPFSYIFLSFLPTSLSAARARARAFGRILLAKPKKLAKLDTHVNCAQQAIGAKHPTTVADFR